MPPVSILPSLAAFALVIAAIPAALWVLKRAQALRPSAAGTLQLVAGLSLGPRERIAVVNVGGRALVVGITAQSITHLATLDEPVQVEPAGSALAAGPASGAFARVLAARLHKGRQDG